MGLCKRFRRIILTDYIDAELPKETKKCVENHLRECADCRSLAEKARSKLILPFQGLKSVPVPETLWSAVKEKICERRKYPEDRIESWVAKLKGHLYLPRLSPALIGFILLVLVSSLLFCNQQIKLAQEKEQAGYLSSLLGTTGALLGTATNNFGTLIEEFFL
jgi:predicted anti-sigma-YlaC factor YlaD